MSGGRGGGERKKNSEKCRNPAFIVGPSLRPVWMRGKREVGAWRESGRNECKG